MRVAATLKSDDETGLLQHAMLRIFIEYVDEDCTLIVV